MSKKNIFNSLEDLFYFRVYYIENNTKVFNNDSVLNSQNWDKLKDVFFKQRIEKYEFSYTYIEKIHLEQKSIENIIINKTEYEILKIRYLEYLENKLIEANTIENQIKKNELKTELFIKALKPNFKFTLDKEHPYYYEKKLKNYNNSFINSNTNENTFNNSLKLLMQNIFLIHKTYFDYKNNSDITLLNDIVLLNFDIYEIINSFKIIELEISKDVNLKNHVIFELKRFKTVLEFDLFIDIDISPINEQFNKYYEKFDLINVIKDYPKFSEVKTTNKVNTTIEEKKELYNHIFIGNAFEVFEKYHSTKNLAENCKTDLNLLFQLFKRDNLFHENIELKHYIQWLNSTYKYSLIQLKKVSLKTRPNIQRTNEYNEYKKTTLK